MNLSIKKVNDIYIFIGKYQDRFIPKRHQFKWDPDNNYWYTYESFIAQDLLRCLLNPEICIHMKEGEVMYNVSTYSANKYKYPESIYVPIPPPSNTNIDWYNSIIDLAINETTKLYSKTKGDTISIKPTKVKKEEVDEKIIVTKRKIILE